ncbi:MAG: geranylgeranyl reductase family protein [Micrococcales bacterium]|nr:geranylgeranyl reductase family protein [Micrococcales bacterium]
MVAKSAEDAEVLIVGAGPAGSTAAAHLANAGVNALVLEKASFPRQKACGDGLTPRAVKELATLGISTKPELGWVRNRGLMVFGGGHTLELPWPTIDSFPNYGLSMARERFDQLLIDHALARGATFRQNTTVTDAVRHPGTGRVTGVKARTENGERTFKARYVVDAGGVAGRVANAAGRNTNPSKPMGLGIRARVKLSQAPSPDRLEWLESHLELWEGEGKNRRLMPGYGWVFPEAGNIINVGVGAVASNANRRQGSQRELLDRWLPEVKERWGFGENDVVDPPRGAALPMAFSRQPLYNGGLLLLGDAAGLVSPFDGEGVSYAMQSARLAADAMIQALRRPTPDSAERAMRDYPARLKADLGGYFSLGRVFVFLIEHPRVMHWCTTYGLPRPTLMRLVMKLLSDLYEPRGGDWMDRLIATAARLAPAP